MINMQASMNKIITEDDIKSFANISE